MANHYQLVQGDAIAVANATAAESVDLVIVDPPYYRVKDLDWDRQWTSEQDYLAWLESCLVAFVRILKPSGALYLFCSSRLGADTEIMMRRHMQLLNHIVWAKPNGRWNGCHKEALRSYFPATERILFAERRGADNHARAGCGYQDACQQLRRQIFSPLIEYFRTAREQAGITASEINAATGVSMASHWFGASQWQLPSEAQYLVLQALFARKRGEALAKGYPELAQDYRALTSTYHELSTSYASLREQFDRLRRPFFVTASVPYTDVWTYAPVQHYPGKHLCEKPALMLEHMIQASSRPGDTVADFFVGSGSTAKAAIRLGRRFIGAELDSDRFAKTKDELAALTAHPILTPQ